MWIKVGPLKLKNFLHGFEMEFSDPAAVPPTVNPLDMVSHRRLELHQFLLNKKNKSKKNKKFMKFRSVRWGNRPSRALNTLNMLNMLLHKNKTKSHKYKLI